MIDLHRIGAAIDDIEKVFSRAFKAIRAQENQIGETVIVDVARRFRYSGKVSAGGMILPPVPGVP